MKEKLELKEIDGRKTSGEMYVCDTYEEAKAIFDDIVKKYGKKK